MNTLQTSLILWIPSKSKQACTLLCTGLKSDWLQYANHNTIHQELTLAPDKKTINLTIESFLNDLWFKSWDDIAGHTQTKYWLPRPDSFLATKLLTMSRKHLGFNIQFFSGHGWWRKHLNDCQTQQIRQMSALFRGSGSQNSNSHILWMSCNGRVQNGVIQLHLSITVYRSSISVSGQWACPSWVCSRTDWENRSIFLCSPNGIDTVQDSDFRGYWP